MNSICNHKSVKHTQINTPRYTLAPRDRV